MKPTSTLIIMALLLTGCALTPTKDFVQGSIRITPPIEQYPADFAIIEDGGTAPGMFTDAKGRTFNFYIDRRIGTKTRGAIYLNAYPGEWKSVRVKNDAEFKQKLDFK